MVENNHFSNQKQIYKKNVKVKKNVNAQLFMPVTANGDNTTEKSIHHINFIHSASYLLLVNSYTLSTTLSFLV